MVRTIVLVLLALSAAACATSFTGEAHFPGGPRGCAEQCAKDGMEMASFVYAGEFSSACVCQPRGAGRSPAASTEAGTSAIVGVMTQMRAQQQRASHR
ncbi:MAG: hypothetical protein K0S65_6257 [Labilithrix sp.]|nr:hypothetical protein [Labilithrix sp.]